MKPRIRLLGLLGVIALVASIELQAADRMQAPQSPATGLAQIREGLAAQMRMAASSLDAADRLEATTALNRARHLASAAAEASTLVSRTSARPGPHARASSALVTHCRTAIPPPPSRGSRTQPRTSTPRQQATT